MNPLSESTYLVLLALYHEPLHGYGIIKSIEKVSEGAYIIAPGTLYGVLKNLQKQGLIETVKEEKNHRKKKTYCITEQGKETLRAEFHRYENIIFFTKKIMKEKEL
ncbi:PadR family transcriptional regulator [Halalkalibacter flavus]|uniref:PadR family transcriptional regulator n=1 Tax=Halalkalibacter flavus TaxID=3090668 RepID=UPI002FCA709E